MRNSSKMWLPVVIDGRRRSRIVMKNAGSRTAGVAMMIGIKMMKGILFGELIATH